MALATAISFSGSIDKDQWHSWDNMLNAVSPGEMLYWHWW